MRSFNVNINAGIEILLEVTTEIKSYKCTCIKLMREKEKVSHMKDIQSFLLTIEPKLHT